jgi:predicted kinase
MEPGTASRHCNESSILPKRLIIMCGLPGAGKTTTAHRIRQAMKDAIVISRDHLRNPYRGNGCLHEYSNWQATIVDRRFFFQTEQLLFNHTTVILDATFLEYELRQAAFHIAQKHGCQFLVIECICSFQILLKRLTRQMLLGHKKFVKPPKEILKFYISNIQMPESEMNWTNFIKLDTENNQIILNSLQDHSCQFAKQLIKILEQPFDPSSFDPYCTTPIQESVTVQEISQFSSSQNRKAEMEIFHKKYYRNVVILVVEKRPSLAEFTAL